MCKNLHFLTNFEGISGNLGKVYFKLFKLVFNFYEGDLDLNYQTIKLGFCPLSIQYLFTNVLLRLTQLISDCK